jgi:hypothetical protein
VSRAADDVARQIRITAEEAVMSGTVIETDYGGVRAERAAG